MDVGLLVHALDNIVCLFKDEMPVVSSQIVEDYRSVEVVIKIYIALLMGHSSKLSSSVVVVSAFNITFLWQLVWHLAFDIS